MIVANMTTEEVRKFFRLESVRTVRRWIDEELFPNAFKVKGEILIPESDVFRLQEIKKIKPQPQSQSPTSPKRRILSRGVE